MGHKPLGLRASRDEVQALLGPWQSAEHHVFSPRSRVDHGLVLQLMQQLPSDALLTSLRCQLQGG